LTRILGHLQPGVEFLKSRVGLPIGICAVITLSLIIGGCGSEGNQGSLASKAAPKRAKEVKVQPKVPMGLLDEGDSKLTEISPPTKPGEFGITADQLRFEPMPENPAQLIVSPPIKPGEPGLSVEALKARRAKEEPLNPYKSEISPPLKPGEKAPSVAEFYKLRGEKSWAELNPDEFAVSPSTKPGEKGMTVSQFKTMREKNPWNPGEIPPLPIGGATTGSANGKKPD
jgi:hypothetical protein